MTDTRRYKAFQMKWLYMHDTVLYLNIGAFLYVFGFLISVLVQLLADSKDRCLHIPCSWHMYFHYCKNDAHDIWVSFCRAGTLAVLCPFFLKRASVWPNLMRKPRFFFNCHLFIICSACQKHFGWTCGAILKYPNFDRFYPTIGGFGHILRSDYSLPVTKRVQLDMN